MAAQASPPLWLVAAVVVGVVVAVVVAVIMVYCCRRRARQGKYHGSASLPDGENSHNKNGGFTPGLAPNNKITQGQQLLHPLENSKWPMKPGVQVHVNSLTSLPSHEIAQ